jgi:hypothetical protein
MAATFAKAGYPVVDYRIDLVGETGEGGQR